MPGGSGGSGQGHAHWQGERGDPPQLCLPSPGSRGVGDIADSPKMLAEWNKEHPFDTLTGGRDMDSDNLDTAPGEGGGDERFNAMNLNRARMIPRDIWPQSVQQFADQWNQWKESNDLLDFTDLIELSLDSVTEAPNTPDILFVDEAQDMDALEMALVRKWARAAGGPR